MYIIILLILMVFICELNLIGLLIAIFVMFYFLKTLLIYIIVDLFTL